MKKYGLLVGIEEYEDQSIRRLQCALNDVNRIAEEFCGRCGFDQTAVLTGEQARPGPIADAVGRMSLAMQPEDIFFFFFAGHGFEHEGFGHLLLLHGARRKTLEYAFNEALGVRELRRFARSMSCHHMVFAIDACRGDLSAGRGLQGPAMGHVAVRDIELLAAAKDDWDCRVISSCSPGEVAMEVEALRSGLFTEAFLQVVADLSKNSDSIAIGLEFVQSVKERMIAIIREHMPTHRQRPYLEGGMDGLVIKTPAANEPRYSKRYDGKTNGSSIRHPVPPCAPHIMCQPSRVLAQFPMSSVESREVQTAFSRSAGIHDEVHMCLCNGLSIQGRLIPPGTFEMGAAYREACRTDNESPGHAVELPEAFYVGIYPITQAQYEQVMGENPSAFKGHDRPVERVNWRDAMAFCCKLQERTGIPVRLPTEAEWEYACRAGTPTPFWTGDTLATSQANYDGNYVYGNGVRGVYRKETTKVLIFGANAWGVHDMHGNVWEWCQDWYGSDYYCRSERVAPKGPNIGTARVVRGGSWDDDPRFCRSASRDARSPSTRDSNLGFRIVFSAANARGEASCQEPRF
jgi:hypothetical protein